MNDDDVWYQMDNVVLKRVHSIKYMRVIMDKNSKFQLHSAYIIKKMTKNTFNEN